MSCAFVARVESESGFIGSGFLVADEYVVTCFHVGRPAWQDSLLTTCDVVFPNSGETAKPMLGTVVNTNGKYDLLLIRISCCPRIKPVRLLQGLTYADRHHLARAEWTVVGYSGRDASQFCRTVVIDSPPRFTAAQDSGRLLEVQVDQGLENGFSGAPLLIKAGQDAFCIGMPYVGGEKSASSRFILADCLVGFLERAIPGLFRPLSSREFFSNYDYAKREPKDLPPGVASVLDPGGNVEGAGVVSRTSSGENPRDRSRFDPSGKTGRTVLAAAVIPLPAFATNLFPSGKPSKDADVVPREPAYVRIPEANAIRCEASIIRQYTGVDLPASYYATEAKAYPWYQRGGPAGIHEIGNLLELHGIPVQRYFDADVADLMEELLRGHKVIIRLEPGEWRAGEWRESSMLADIGHGAAPESAKLLVSGIDTSDPRRTDVVFSDPANGGMEVRCPLEGLTDAWGERHFSMVATQAPPPQHLHLPEMRCFDYEAGHITHAAPTVDENAQFLLHDASPGDHAHVSSSYSDIHSHALARYGEHPGILADESGHHSEIGHGGVDHWTLSGHGPEFDDAADVNDGYDDPGDHDG